MDRIHILLVPLLLLGACGDDGPGPVDPEGANTLLISGEVTQIQDLTPVDGGVTIDLLLDGGGAERALFPSLFTSPPPGEDLLRLYDVVRRVEVGDLVRVEGTRTERGIAIVTLWILEGSF